MKDFFTSMKFRSLGVAMMFLGLMGCDSDWKTDYFLYALISKEESDRIFFLSTIDMSDNSPTEIPFGRGMEQADPVWSVVADTAIRHLESVELGDGFYRLTDNENFLSSRPVSAMMIHVGNVLAERYDVVSNLTNTNLANIMHAEVTDSSDTQYTCVLRLKWSPADRTELYRCAMYDLGTSDSLVYFTIDTSLGMRFYMNKGELAKSFRVSIMACSPLLVTGLTSMKDFIFQGDSTAMEYLRPVLERSNARRRWQWEARHTTFSHVAGTYSEQSQIVEVRRSQ